MIALYFGDNLDMLREEIIKYSISLDMQVGFYSETESSEEVLVEGSNTERIFL